MPKTLTRARRLLGLPDDHPLGRSFADRFPPEHHLRANSALGSIETSVIMGESDEQAVKVAKLLLRGINRMHWADR